MEEIKHISFGDTKEVMEKDGSVREVSMFIPDCCREGWTNCPHVVSKKKTVKTNIGL